MTTLTVRPYRKDADLQPIADFLNYCEAADQRDHYFSVDDLRLEFSDPEFDPAQDLRLWEDENGQLIAFGQIWLSHNNHEADGFLWFCVHPQQKGRLESEVLAWGEGRMRQVKQTRHLPTYLRLDCHDNQLARRALFARKGFAIERRFLTMQRSLLEPIPQPQLPPGFALDHVRGGSDIEAWVELYNQTFVDHWNYHPLTIERHQHWLAAPTYRPELDLVAIAPSHTFAAFCYCQIDEEANRKRHRSEGWIGRLGTRRGFRRMGLGRAMLLLGLQQLQLAGLRTAKLGVDTDNSNCAQTLYESVGFQKLYTRLAYVKEIDA